MFEQSLVVSGNRAKTKKPLTMAISLAIQVGVILVLVIIPLIYTQVLPASIFTSFMQPPPPPPPTPAAPAADAQSGA